MIEDYDKIECRCGMLGHQVAFRYCRMVNNGLPCSKVFDCWFEQIPIESFIKQHYSQENIDKILSPPKPKMTTLMELIEKAKNTRR